jgi:hypothetical protein
MDVWEQLEFFTNKFRSFKCGSEYWTSTAFLLKIELYQLPALFQTSYDHSCRSALVGLDPNPEFSISVYRSLARDSAIMQKGTYIRMRLSMSLYLFNLFLTEKNVFFKTFVLLEKCPKKENC